MRRSISTNHLDARLKAFIFQPLHIDEKRHSLNELFILKLENIFRNKHHVFKKVVIQDVSLTLV